MGFYKKMVGIGALVLITLVGALLAIGIAGYKVPFLPQDSDVSHLSPFSDYIGKELEVQGSADLVAWNDFPDKERILSYTVVCNSGYKNRFVSHVKPLKDGQKMVVQSAWKSFLLFETNYYYKVKLQDMDIPAEIDVKLNVGLDGKPNPSCFK
jgi:hypothetical protein